MNVEELVAASVTEWVQDVPVPEMAPASIRAGARRRARRRRALAASALAGLLAVGGAVTATVHGRDGRAVGPSDRTSGRAQPEPGAAGASGALPGGPYTVAFGDRPVSAVIDVPPGYDVVDGSYVYRGTLGEGPSLSLWTVGAVNPRPCQSSDVVDPGSTVHDLAEALAGQALLRPTDPAPVRLDGYDGLYLEQTVPTDLRRRDCPARREAPGSGGAGTNVGPAFFLDSWQTPGGRPDGYFAPGQVHRIWILDVDGLRMVVDATRSGAATDPVRRQLDRMLASLDFVRSR